MAEINLELIITYASDQWTDISIYKIVEGAYVLIMGDLQDGETSSSYYDDLDSACTKAREIIPIPDAIIRAY